MLPILIGYVSYKYDGDAYPMTIIAEKSTNTSPPINLSGHDKPFPTYRRPTMENQSEDFLAIAAYLRFVTTDETNTCNPLTEPYIQNSLGQHSAPQLRRLYENIIQATNVASIFPIRHDLLVFTLNYDPKLLNHFIDDFRGTIHTLYRLVRAIQLKPEANSGAATARPNASEVVYQNAWGRDNGCVVTGSQLTSELAHIIPHAICKYDDQNTEFFKGVTLMFGVEFSNLVFGLCGGPNCNNLANVMYLDTRIHKLFDNHCISMRPISDRGSGIVNYKISFAKPIARNEITSSRRLARCPHVHGTYTSLNHMDIILGIDPGSVILHLVRSTISTLSARNDLTRGKGEKRDLGI